MRLKSKREYVWKEDGVDAMIQDYMIFVDYYKNTDLKKQWEFEKSDSLDGWKNNLKVFDEIAYKEEIDKAILNILEEIQSIRDEDTVGGYYDKTTGINTTLHEYYLEVTAVEDSIVIAKIIGSRNPVFNVRQGDWIFISK